jgi:hypothetical protein
VVAGTVVEMVTPLKCNSRVPLNLRHGNLVFVISCVFGFEELLFLKDLFHICRQKMPLLIL